MTDCPLLSISYFGGSMNKTISVIIPVYNVERYLAECLDSVCGQSYTDLEIILIDDGSTDSSGQICDAYAAKDSRIRVIHQPNGGAAAAKNAGLRAATGTYLTFADSDDIVADGAYEKMVNTLENSDADIVQGAFELMFTDGNKAYCNDQFDESAEEFLLRFTEDWTCGLLWDKIYRQELFNNIFFVEGNVIDDEFFTYRGVMNAKNVVSVSDIVYLYRQRKSSVVRSHNTQKRIVFDRLHYLKQRRLHIAERYPQLSATFDEHYLNMLLILSHAAAATMDSIKETKCDVIEYFKNPHSYRPTLGFSLKILQMLITPTRVILKHRDKPSEERNLERCFP